MQDIVSAVIKADDVVCFDRIIHEGGFTKDDNKAYIPIVHSNTIQALVAIIRAMATLHIDYADSDREVFCFSVMCMSCETSCLSKVLLGENFGCLSLTSCDSEVIGLLNRN